MKTDCVASFDIWQMRDRIDFGGIQVNTEIYGGMSEGRDKSLSMSTAP